MTLSNRTDKMTAGQQSVRQTDRMFSPTTFLESAVTYNRTNTCTKVEVMAYRMLPPISSSYSSDHHLPRGAFVQEPPDADWLAVIGRCMAYRCLKNSEFADAQLLEQVEFLKRFGLPVDVVVELLGSSRNSLNVLTHRAKKKKAVSGNGKVKRR